MSEVVGEVWVAVRPETAGFGPALSRDVSAAAATAGQAGSRQLSQSLQSYRTPAGLKDTERELGALDRGAAAAAFSFRGFGRAVAYASGGFLVAGSAVATLKSAVSAAADLQGEQALLSRSLENAGAANSLYGESVDDLLRKQALQFGFSETELLPAFARLVQATHSSQAAYKDLGLAEDLARQRNVSLSVAALAVGKAADGTVTSLQRYGIVLPAYAKQLDTAQRGALALAVAQERVGGSAAEFAQTGAGALDRLGAASEVLKETVGTALLPEVQHVAVAVADWTSNSDNLARVERDAAQAGQILVGGIKGTADAFGILDRAVSPVVSLLGGYGNVAELAFGLVALRKVQQITSATVAWGRAETARASTFLAGSGAEAKAAAATSAYTESVVANTAALEANTVAMRLNLSGFNTVSVGARTAASSVENAGVEAAAARTGFLSLSATTTGLASVFTSGLAPAVALGSYELSKFIEKIPGWTSTVHSLGGALEDLASKVGLAPGGIGQASAAAAGQLSNPAVQQKLAQAYQAAARQPGFARDRIVQQLVGPGFTFHDAQVFAQFAARAPERAAARQAAGAGSRRNYNPADITAAARSGRPTDADYQLAVAQAQAASNTRAELGLYTQRVDYLKSRIDRLKADGDLTQKQKQQELGLYKQLSDVESQITTIHQKSADDAKQHAQAVKEAAQKEQQAYQSEVTSREQELQLELSRAQLAGSWTAAVRKDEQQLVVFYRQEATDAKLTQAQRAQYASQLVQTEQSILQSEQQAYQDRLSLEEQRLQLAAQRAQLTQKTVTDDKAAARKLIAFYQREAHDAKLTEQQRLQYASQAVSQRVSLQNLTGGQAQGATAAELFAEAASEYGSYGSNIAARSGVLSGQDERAAFAKLLLDSRHVGRNADQARHEQALTEAQRHTALLTEIRDRLPQVRHGLSSPGTTSKPQPLHTRDLRKTHGLIGVN